MFYLKKKLTISASHCLELDYNSKCENFHGHNWDIVIYLKRKDLDNNGMVYDFTNIKKFFEKYDHKNLNDILDFNPTAENMAKYFCEKIPYCYRVDIIETKNNEVNYIKDGEPNVY